MARHKRALNNLKLSLKKPATWVVSLIALVLMLVFYNITTDYELIFGNFGPAYYYLTISLSVIISILFGLSAGMLWYRGNVFRADSGAVAGGSFIGMLVGGCSACSISFASAVGLGGLLSALPYGGIELKLLAILILGFTTFNLAENLHVCKRR